MLIVVEPSGTTEVITEVSEVLEQDIVPIDEPTVIPSEILELLGILTKPSIIQPTEVDLDVLLPKEPLTQALIEIRDELEETLEANEGEPLTPSQTMLLKAKLKLILLKNGLKQYKWIIPVIIIVGVISIGLISFQYSKSYVSEKGKVKARG